MDDTYPSFVHSSTNPHCGSVGPDGPRKEEKSMPTYIMMTRITPEAVTDPKYVEKLERKVVDKITKKCPEVKWIGSYSVLGPYDYVDIFDAPDAESATKVALLVRSFGHGMTETWVATPWDRFVQLAKEAA